MKKYNIYHYDYDFDYGYFDREYIDTIYLDESETIMDGLKRATFDHDLYKILENLGHGAWELTSEQTKDFYHIVLSEK